LNENQIPQKVCKEGGRGIGTEARGGTLQGLKRKKKIVGKEKMARAFFWSILKRGVGKGFGSRTKGGGGEKKLTRPEPKGCIRNFGLKWG